jgi:hypothetical protein
MASQASIANQALVKLGAKRIVSIDDDARQARELKAIWDAKRDAEMAAYPWSFACHRAQLPALAEAPVYGYTRAFPLPTDYLSMVEVGEYWTMYQPAGSELFTIEGGNILTNDPSPLRIRYVRRIENTGLWSPLFNEALACRLAFELCETLTQSPKKQQIIQEQYELAIRKARRTNAIERAPQRTVDDSWTLALRSGLG